MVVLTLHLSLYSTLQAFRADFAAAAKTITALDPSILAAKVDADTEKDIGERFSIDGFPTFKWFEDGEAVSEFSDELSEEMLVEWVKKLYQGGSDEITSMKQAEELLTNENANAAAVPILVIGYFKNGFKDTKDKEYKAFKKRKDRYLPLDNVYHLEKIYIFLQFFCFTRSAAFFDQLIVIFLFFLSPSFSLLNYLQWRWQNLMEKMFLSTVLLILRSQQSSALLSRLKKPRSVLL